MKRADKPSPATILPRSVLGRWAIELPPCKLPSQWRKRLSVGPPGGGEGFGTCPFAIVFLLSTWKINQLHIRIYERKSLICLQIGTSPIAKKKKKIGIKKNSIDRRINFLLSFVSIWPTTSVRGKFQELQQSSNNWQNRIKLKIANKINKQI